MSIIEDSKYTELGKRAEQTELAKRGFSAGVNKGKEMGYTEVIGALQSTPAGLAATAVQEPSWMDKLTAWVTPAPEPQVDQGLQADIDWERQRYNAQNGIK